MSVLQGILQALGRRPKNAAQLARELDLKQAIVETGLLQLQRGNYITPAPPGAVAPAPTCSSCAMTHLCSSKPCKSARCWCLTAKGETARTSVLATGTL